jgi:hypothetical protein
MNPAWMNDMRQACALQYEIAKHKAFTWWSGIVIGREQK